MVPIDTRSQPVDNRAEMPHVSSVPRAKFEALIDQTAADVATAVALSLRQGLPRDAAEAIRSALRVGMCRAREYGAVHPAYHDADSGTAEWVDSDTSPGNARGKRMSERPRKP